MPSKENLCSRHLRLIANNSRSVVPRLRSRKIRLELFVSGDGEARASTNSFEELAVVHDNGSQPSFRNAAPGAKGLSIMKELITKSASGHKSSGLLSSAEYAGFYPHKSTGNYPHAGDSKMRDNARTMGTVDGKTLRARIKQALEEEGLTPNRASDDAGLDRDYISDLLKDPLRSPRWDTIRKIAKGVRRSAEWLVSLDEPIEMLTDAERVTRVLDDFRALPEDKQRFVQEILEGLRLPRTG